MSTIIPFLSGNSGGSFDPETIEAMSRALDAACEALGIGRDKRAREVIAGRIIDLARRGVTGSDTLRDRVIKEAGSSPGSPPGGRWRGQQQPKGRKTRIVGPRE